MSEANQIQNAANQPSLSNRISQFFRSVWDRLFCCKKPAGENSSSGTQSEDEVEEKLPVYVSPFNKSVHIDPETNRVVSIYERSSPRPSGSKPIRGKNTTLTA